MKTFTTSQAQGFKVAHASAMTSGYGHKKVTVEVEYDGNYKEFTATTSNMPAYDEANMLEGQEKYEAFFEMVESPLDGEISEWISENYE